MTLFGNTSHGHGVERNAPSSSITRVKNAIALLLSSGFIGGCGTYVPKIELLAGSQQEVSIIVNKIANQVRCEIRQAVLDATGRYDEVAWLKDWSAKVTLRIVVDEKSTFAPGISLNTIFPNAITIFGSQTVTTAQSYSFGIGGQFSSDATRTEQVGFFFVFSELIAQSGPCPYGEGTLIQSDLKLGEWLLAASLVASTPGTVSQPFQSGAPLDVISHEVQFIIVAGANATPTWKLVAVTANPNGPLLGATRTRTDDVLITMGPLGELNKNGRPVASVAVENSHLASQIVSGLQNRLP
jgi:hypothetical protein